MICHVQIVLNIMQINGLKFRWINCQNFEIELPNKKHIITDPYVKNALPGHCEPHQTSFEVEDYEQADYIIVQHTHFDHDFSAGDIYSRLGGKFIVHEAVAYEFGKCFDIPFTNIYTYATNGKYVFEDFTLQTFKGYHSVNKWISGRPSENEDGGMLHFGIPGHEILECMGTMFNSSFVITTKENLRIAFVAGVELQDVTEHLKEHRPNIMFRQLGVCDAKKDIDLIAESGAMLTVPMHHETLLFRGIDVAAQVSEMNEALAERNCSGRIFYPERNQWYNVGCFVEEA